MSDVSEATTVLIVDDHPMVRDGLAAVLGGEADIDVVGVASDVAGARSAIEHLRPTVVVTDYQLPDGSGLDVAAAAAGAGCRWLLIAAVGVGGVGVVAVRAGCDGFVH